MTFHKGRATDAIFDSKLPALQKLIMLCYIKHANAKGIAWPGGDRLAKMTSTSPTSIKRHRRALMRAGVLIKIEGGDGSVYRFVINLNNIPTGVTETPVSEENRYQNDTSPGVTEIPVPGSQRYPNTHKEEDTENIHKLPSAEFEEGEISIERIQSVWQSMMEISKGSEVSSHRLKLTPWRTSMIRQRMKSYSHDEIVYAWQWWNESVHEQAIYLRKNRGPAGIDTFLRRSNHDKYQAFAESWKPVIHEPGPNASIEDMRTWLDYKNRKMISGK